MKGTHNLMNKAKRAGSLLLALCVLALSSQSAFAGTTVTLNPGSLSITCPGPATFPPVTLNGETLHPQAPLGVFLALDSRGSGAGWHVVAAATQFKEWNGSAYGVKTLPLRSLAMSAPTVTPIGTQSRPPAIVPGPYTLDTGGSPITVASAARRTGMGLYSFCNSVLTATILPTTYAKTYRSEITLTIVSGP